VCVWTSKIGQMKMAGDREEMSRLVGMQECPLPIGMLIVCQNRMVTYIDAAFRSSGTNEAYLFMRNEYVRVNELCSWNQGRLDREWSTVSYL
jgi:hypothetical protein